MDMGDKEYKLYYWSGGKQKFLQKYKSLLEASEVASRLGYIKFKITANFTQTCLIGIRKESAYANERGHSYIQWRTHPTMRGGGGKRL